MNTNDEHQLSHQQQRFCDEYLVHFNAFKAAVNAGYSENTARKGELLHLPKVQYYLQDAMRKTQSRLQITHDMILSELAKIAFSNMGNYYDEYAVLKPMNQLTNDEKAAISQYQIMDAIDDRGQRIGELSKIKLHNKMSALDKIARHLNFYGTVGKVAVAAAVAVNPAGERPKVESPESGLLVITPTRAGEPDSELSVVNGEVLSSTSESPEIRCSELAVVSGEPEGGTVSMKSEVFADPVELAENMENILTLSPLAQCLNDGLIEGLNGDDSEYQKTPVLLASRPLAEKQPLRYRTAL